MRDWPGFAGPLVHVPDPLSPADSLVATLAASIAPDYRVLSVRPRGDSPCQVDAVDLLGVLDQFGFASSPLIAERLGSPTALLLAAWYPERVPALILVDPAYGEPGSGSLAARALRDCPPDWPSLRRAVRCPVLEVHVGAASLVDDVVAILKATLP